jgi:hypothetical protein
MTKFQLRKLELEKPCPHCGHEWKWHSAGSHWIPCDFIVKPEELETSKAACGCTHFMKEN